MELIANTAESSLIVQVFNVKNQSTRGSSSLIKNINNIKFISIEITLNPTSNWPGKGLLGVTIRFDSFENAHDQMLHVLEVKIGSPAAVSGLEPYMDYLLGTPERVYKGN